MDLPLQGSSRWTMTKKRLLVALFALLTVSIALPPFQWPVAGPASSELKYAKILHPLEFKSIRRKNHRTTIENLGTGRRSAFEKAAPAWRLTRAVLGSVNG